jgi:hypothetical protein
MDYRLLTHVMDARHLLILDDWLSFLAVPPKGLTLVIGKDVRIREAVESYCRERSLAVDITDTAAPEELKAEETRFLMRQFGAVGQGMCLVLRLDTFPFRIGHEQWLNTAEGYMKEREALFLTGSTRPYRGDVPTGIPYLLLTGRLSNNMLFVEAQTWQMIQNEMARETFRFHRFATEGLFELYCARTGAGGLRRINTSDWRVFHTQAWGDRADTVRSVFRSGGRAVDAFLEGYEDDQLHPWDQYFMYPRPSAVHRAWIRLGRLRRKLSGA